MCVLWEGKGGRADKSSPLLTCSWVWANETSLSEPSFHQRCWGRTADEDLGWGFVASENHSPLGSFYIFICKTWSLNLGSLKERMPFNPSRYSVFNLNLDTETTPQIKKVFLEGVYLSSVHCWRIRVHQRRNDLLLCLPSTWKFFQIEIK